MSRDCTLDKLTAATVIGEETKFELLDELTTRELAKICGYIETLA